MTQDHPLAKIVRSELAFRLGSPRAHLAYKVYFLEGFGVVVQITDIDPQFLNREFLTTYHAPGVLTDDGLHLWNTVHAVALDVLNKEADGVEHDLMAAIVFDAAVITEAMTAAALVREAAQ